MRGAKIARKYLGDGDLAGLFDAIGNEQKHYNWVVTDDDFFTLEEPLNRRFSWTGVFLTGDELVESFLRAFPQAADLAETNRKANAMERRITEIFHREAEACGIRLDEETEKYKYGIFQTLCLNGDGSEHFDDVTDKKITEKARIVLRIIQQKSSG
jgi:hypothetical protein